MLCLTSLLFKHGRVLAQPEKVLHAHLNRGEWDILVKWMDQAAADTTWEKVQKIQGHLPFLSP
jgi:hypothetical protein